eukprot:8299459-Lingulodinium_polyedra.AAC.1
MAFWAFWVSGRGSPPAYPPPRAFGRAGCRRLVSPAAAAAVEARHGAQGLAPSFGPGAPPVPQP